MSTAQSVPLPSSGAIMIGPTRAGKTCLLATLELASRFSRYPGLGQVGVFPRNDAAEKLFENARMIGEVGHVELPGTIKPEEYLIDLNYSRPGGCLLFGLGQVNQIYRFTVIDGRGGDLIGKPH